MGMKETKDMDCTSNNPLPDQVLLQYIDGEAAAEIGEHLEHCLFCREQAEALQSVQASLTSDLYRLDCPSTQELSEYHLQMLPRSVAQRIETHVSSCAHCAREINEFDSFMTQVRPDIEAHPLARVKILVAKLLGGPEGTGQGTLAPAMVGVRGAGADTRMYSAGDLQLNIEIQIDPAHPERTTLLGLALGPAPEDYQARLLLNGQEIATSLLDDLGNFSFQNLQAGDYDLILQGSEHEIHVPSIAI